MTVAIARTLALAIALCTASIAQSDPAATYQQALKYHLGEGVVQDYRRAAALMQEAADLEHAPAQNHLGRYYFEGLGVAEDRAAALTLLEAAASQGDAQFVFDLAQVLEQSTETQSRAANLYAQAAQSGLIEAAVSLGVMYQKGNGVAKDTSRARALYEQAVEDGNPRAMNNLGLLYAQADGVKQDYQRAAELFAQAAATGMPQAMRNLATLYENGFGVPLDETRAQELYRAAAGTNVPAAITYVADARISLAEPGSADAVKIRSQAQRGDPIAQFQVAHETLNNEGATFAEIERAATYLTGLAKWGHGPSMFNLALLYRRGIAVPQDYTLAYAWMLLADARDIGEAKPVLADMQATLTAEQLNEAQSYAKSLWLNPGISE